MVSLYERVCEIRKATGWSQERISVETGLHISTVSRIFRVPGYEGHETSKKILKQLHETVVKSPFPPYIEQLFYFYDTWRESYSKKEFAQYSNVLEQLLVNHKALDSKELSACRLCWLLGHIYHDRAFYLKENQVIRIAESALAWYRKALEVLNHHPDKSLITQKYKIQQCIVSTQFNCCDPNYRAKDEKIQHWLVEMNYLRLVKEVVKEDAWNWVAARNGLVAASILHEWESCLFFWQAMQKVNKHFKNLDFIPSKQLSSLRQDRDLGWFIKQVSGE